MLEKVDLTKTLDKEEFKQLAAELRPQLGFLQRQARDEKIPVVIVFEGLDAADKGTLINELIQTLDPRGFEVFAMRAPGEEELSRPYFWRFWTKTPAKGRIAIFYRSWYRRIIFDRLEDGLSEQAVRDGFHDIASFERQLSDDGTLFIKFFLHIGKKEQKDRLKALEKDPATSWQVTKDVWRRHNRFEEYLAAVEETVRATDTDVAPWTIIEAHDRRFAVAKIMMTVASALQGRVEQQRRIHAAGTSCDVNVADIRPNVVPGVTAKEMKHFTSSVLADLDLSQSLEDNEYNRRLKRCQERLREMESAIYFKRLPVAIAFEGWDAAGKGGSIRKLTERMDPRGYTVIPTSAPNDEEKAHHYLWRFWRAAPKMGHITIYDRSWYGRVLVERVENLCREGDWRRAYQEINEMEEQWVRQGVVLVKFWLQIDQDEQQRRFEARLATADKQWKITGEDWRNREKWNQYEAAVDEMFFRTSTTYAPWMAVEANSKPFARIKVLETVLDAVEKKLS